MDHDPSAPAPDESAVAVCRSQELLDGGQAVSFDLRYGGQTCRAFAVRFRGQVHAYLNRCTHVAMELDWQPDRFFDDTGQWLLCASHGASYRPDTGQCAGGPCRGGLIQIAVSEVGGVVFWHPTYLARPLEF
jgi:nitrite reductase/ring-hydroxylating ferredoxin subunit